MAEPQSGNFLTHKLGPLPIWAWAGIALVAVYLYRRYSSGATTTATTTASTGVSPPTETITTAGGTYSGPVNAAPSSITNPAQPVSTVTTDSGAPGTGASSPGNGGGTPGQTTATTTTVPSTLPSTVNLGGQSLIPIGTITGAGGQYYGYNVAGGAPVLFQAPGAATAAQLSGPSAIEAEPVGTSVYTLASNPQAVSASQVSEKL